MESSYWNILPKIEDCNNVAKIQFKLFRIDRNQKCSYLKWLEMKLEQLQLFCIIELQVSNNQCLHQLHYRHCMGRHSLIWSILIYLDWYKRNLRNSYLLNIFSMFVLWSNYWNNLPTMKDCNNGAMIQFKLSSMTWSQLCNYPKSLVVTQLFCKFLKRVSNNQYWHLCLLRQHRV